MRMQYKLRRRALVGLVLMVTCLFLPGCGDKTPEPSAPGYYSGSMKSKGAPAGAGANAGSANTKADSGTI
jgi:hypothetical protein